MTFRRSDLPAARAFADSVFSQGGAGKPRKHPSTWTDDYTLRVANRWQRDAESGRPLTLASGRGHRGTPEHRRQYEYGQHTIREYRDWRAMLRWIRGMSGYPDEPVQIVGYGYLKAGYQSVTFGDDESEPRKVHRVIFTGPPGQPDGNGNAIRSHDEFREAVGRIFDPMPSFDGAQVIDGHEIPADAFEPYELRWGSAIG